MKTVATFAISLTLLGCSEHSLEEFAFRKSLEHNLIKACGKNDEGCVNAVKTQTKACMVKSNWRKYLDSNDSDAEKKRFTGEFYACIVDADGKPYFVAK